MYYGDKKGSHFYNLLSALQKSVRGSDVNAALYYLAHLLENGDLVAVSRRLLVMAYEDIGVANPSVGADPGMHELGVHALGLETGPADLTGVVGDHERPDDEVARLEHLHGGADLLHHTDVLVTHQRVVDGLHAPVGPQVRPTDAGRGQADDGVGRVRRSAGLRGPRLGRHRGAYMTTPRMVDAPVRCSGFRGRLPALRGAWRGPRPRVNPPGVRRAGVPVDGCTRRGHPWGLARTRCGIGLPSTTWTTEQRYAELRTTRRARLTPDQVGLPTVGTRRVPGLRRSEVAALAGLSVEYYARLERGTDCAPRSEAIEVAGRGGAEPGAAEGVGFEPTVSCPTHAFQACRFGRSRTLRELAGDRAGTVRLSCRWPLASRVAVGSCATASP